MNPLSLAIDRIEDARRIVALCAAAIRNDQARAEDAALILQRYADGELAEALAELQSHQAGS